MRTFASLFSGGGGADIGAAAAGFAPRWAVEHDADIAAVYRVNLGDHIITADVCSLDYAALPRVDWLHASPVCTRYSVANAQRGESAVDIATAQATARAISDVLPEYFTLENVGQYDGSDAYRLICGTLDALGYVWHASVLNAADYGVPQTRRRLILRASRTLLRPMPAPVPWVGWYAAIEDLIPTLPPSQFAAWQLARLPEEVQGSVLVEGRNGTGGSDRWRIQPAQAVTTSHPPRDFIADAPADGARGWLVHHSEMRSDAQRPAEEPAFTIMTHPKNHRAWLAAGRVVAMTPRALARFQSFPDSYALPERKSLACRVIGNAVPPLLMQRVGGAF